MRLDFANVKPSLGSWLIVGLMSVTFISFFKFFFSAILPVPGVSDVFASI